MTENIHEKKFLTTEKERGREKKRRNREREREKRNGKINSRRK